MEDATKAQYERLAQLVRSSREATKQGVNRELAVGDRIAEAEGLRGQLRELNSELVDLAVQLSSEQLAEYNAGEANALLQLAKLISDGAHARISSLGHAIKTLQRQQHTRAR